MLDFFEFSNEMLCIADSRGYFVRLNPAWTKTLGWSVEELLGRPYVEFVHPDDAEATIREAALLFSGTHETVFFENRYRAKDGSYRWLAWYSKLDSDSKQLVATARDISEQKLKAELLRNLIEVQEKEKQFLCHEFHDGLIQYAVGSLMQLEGYKQTKDSTLIDEAIKNLRRGIEDGRRVIQGIRPAVLDEGSLRDALEELVHQFSATGMKVECECDPEIGQLPETTQTTAYRVVQEALNNARKHSGSDLVAIAVRKQGGDLHLAIRDFGRGFDVASARQRGFGLRGMSERAHLSGGECSIQSQPGAGTTISVRLPIPGANEER
jgi:PAS domain S-box-containing protein